MPSLGFGIEKIGLLAIRFPRISLAILLAITVICAIGLPRLEADDAISDLFRSNTKAYKDYETMSKRFPVSEYDVLVIVQGKALLDPANLEPLRNVHFDLALSETVKGLLSVFSMRGKPNARGFSPPLIPDQLPEGAELERLKVRIATDPLIKGKFYAKAGNDGELAIFVLSLNLKTREERGLRAVIDEIQSTTNAALKDRPVTVRYTGAPMMQLEIRESIARDRIIYNGAGFFIGFLVNMAFFRRFWLVIIASICPVLSVVWALGILGLAGEKLNSFNNVIPPLVMVIAFTDAMHMMFAVRRKLWQGSSTREAAIHAIKTVGPACVLTSITTSIALLTLTFTDSGLIRNFGFAAAFGTLIAFFSVVTVIPTLVVLFIDAEKFRASEHSHRKMLDFLEDSCLSLSNFLSFRHLPVFVLSLAFMATAAYMHWQLEPVYRLSDEVPGNKEAIKASRTIDKALAGAHPLHIMVTWPARTTLGTGEVLSVLGAAHIVLETQKGVGNVWGVETLRRWAAENGNGDVETVTRYIKKLPAHLTGRFVNERSRTALVTGRMPNLASTDAVLIMDELDARLVKLRKSHPEFTFSVTGLSALSAFQSANMIGQLNRGLMFAVIIVIALMGLAFRSLRIAIYAIIPNLFPILAAGAWLYISGRGLEYASVIALTVGFGLAVDDTIHFLSRLEYEREKNQSGSVRGAVQATLVRIGPVLMLTTTVLVLGMVATLFSELYSMRLFGELVMTTLGAALIGDALILPALILSLGEIEARVKKEI